MRRGKESHSKGVILFGHSSVSYPQYYMSKGKIALDESLDVDALLDKMEDNYSKEQPLTIDGVKIDFPEGWVHMRKSNTEPIIRVYAEADSQDKADELTQRFSSELLAISKQI